MALVKASIINGIALNQKRPNWRSLDTILHTNHHLHLQVKPLKTCRRKTEWKRKTTLRTVQPFDADEGRGGHKGDLYRQHRALQEEIETAQRSAPTKGPTSPTSSRTPDEKLADDRRMQHILTRSAESESQFSAQTVEQSIFS